MGSRLPKITACLVPILLLAALGPARADEPPPPVALTARLAAPDRQLARLLDLFRGSRADSPAAALAGWKRATRAVQPLSKQADALITLLNPAMVAELRTLDGAAFSLGFDAAGQRRWAATIPADDGTFAALATALALTGGASEDLLGAARVDRLGPPGSALMARSGSTVVVSATRDDLRAALDRLPLPAPPPAEGLHFHLDPAALGTAGPVSRRRVAETLRALGCKDLEGIARLDGEVASLIVTGRWAEQPPGDAGRAIDPSWVDWFPADRSLAAVALSLDPGPGAWDALFAAADRVDKADPARAKLPPLRARLNLYALIAGIKPEADLWPHLRGLSVAATTRPGEATPGALLALHLDGDAAALRIVDGVLPRLVAQFKLADRDAPPADPAPDRIRRLGRAGGRPLEVARRGPTVLLGWGEGTLASALDASDHPEHSAGPALRASWGPVAPRRVGALWPGRLPGLPEGSPLAAALIGSPPILWSGTTSGLDSRDELRWESLREPVRRFLERLPLDPPPDRSTAP